MYFIAGVAAAGIGLVTNWLPAVAIGLITLLPLASHIRWVGARRALTEPSAVTIILFFYLTIFPLRGLVIAADGYTNVEFVLERVTANQLVQTLILAALATTAFVEAFHFCRNVDRRLRPVQKRTWDTQTSIRVATLASVLGVISVAALVAIIFQNGGIGGATAIFSGHSKVAYEEAKTTATSIWATISAPAVWCAAIVALDKNSKKIYKLALLVTVAIILVGELTIFGSQLSTVTALTGAWVVTHYLGHHVSVKAVLVAILAFFLISIPILNQRAQGHVSRATPTLARYSRLTGYAVLDISLAIRQQPTFVRNDLEDSERWSHLPAYLVPSFLPSFLRPSRANINSDRMDAYVVQSFGNTSQQASGFPASFITEWWLYGGWVTVLLIAGIFGGAIGILHRHFLDSRWLSPGSLLWGSLTVTAAFSFYESGDLLSSIVGDWRYVYSLGAVMWATGVWSPFKGARRA